MIKRETIEEIERNCRIEDVVGDFVHLSKRGVNYIGLCPFHNEKTPSFIVSPAKGIYKCFGCGKAGSSIQFIMEHEHYSYVESLRYLAKKYNVRIEEDAPTPEAIRQLNEREALLAVSEFAASFFRKNLLETTEGQNIGLSYFHERDFSDETIEKFQLGYALSDRNALVNAALKSGYTLENLEKAGLVTVHQVGNEEKRQDRFFERAMFPIQNFSGRVIAFGGRVLHNTDKKLAKYINSPETEIYHKSDTLYGLFQAKNAIRKEDKCLLVEGYADVISMHQAGIGNVVASSGTSLTANQVKLIKKLTNDVTVLYDGDDAGVHAAERAVGMMLKEGLNIRIVVLPPEDDPDSFARSHSTREILDYIAQNEKDFLHFRIARFKRQPDHGDPIKRAAFINAVAADIALIPDSITMSVFVKQSCELLDMPEQTLLSAVNRIRAKNYVEARKKAQEQYADTQQIADEAEQITLETPKENQTLKPDFLTEDDVERAILFHLVNYGGREIYVERENDGENEAGNEAEKLMLMRVDSFIFNDLDQDRLQLKNALYSRFYQYYHQCWEQDLQNVGEKMQAGMEDADLQALYTSLLDVKPMPSPLWKKRHSYIHTIDDHNTDLLKEDVVKVLQTYRLLQLRKMKNSISEELKSETDEEDIRILLYKIQQINHTICLIEKQLGVNYR